MKKMFKVIVLVILYIVGGIIVSIIVSCALLWAGFHIAYWKELQNTPRPGYLTQSEISVIETGLALTFPVSSRQIKAYYDGDGGLYCYVEFDQNDLQNFKIGREWLSREKGGKILGRNAYPPLRRTVGFFGGEPVELEWWRVSQEQVICISSAAAPNDPGGHIDIILQTSGRGKVGAYMAWVAARHTFPSGILSIFPINKIGWDLRESKEYPKRAGIQ